MKIPCPFLITVATLILTAAAQADPPIARGPLSGERPAPPAKPRDLLHRSYLLGDWGGERSKLETQGVTFDLQYVNDYLGLARADLFGHRNNDFGRVRFTMDVDFGKLAGWDGLSFHFSAINQTGDNAGASLRSYTNPSSIAGTESTRVDTFWLQQKLFNGVVVIRAGQLAQQDDYGVQEYGASFLMEPLGYAFGNLFGNVNATFDPASKPGVELQLHPYGGFYVKSEFQGGEPDPYGKNDPHGLSFDTRGPGVLATEIGYRQDDLATAPLPPAAAYREDGKGIATDSLAEDRVKTLIEGGLPAVYKVGLYNDFGDFSLAARPVGATRHGNYLVYGMINQALFREAHYGPKYFHGLDAFLGGDYSPGEVSLASWQIDGGLRYTGLIPGRDQDTLAAGVVHTNFSNRFNTPASIVSNGRYRGETAIELNYAAHLTPWLLIQPTAQYYVNPGGTDQQKDAIVLGVRTKIIF